MHLHVAITVPFIAICLASDMKETQTKRIRLPEDSPECFAEIVEWCYTGRSPLRLRKLTSATPMTASFNSTSSSQARPYGIDDMIRKDKATGNPADTRTFKPSEYVLSPAWEAAQHRNEERVAHAIKTYTLGRKLLMEDLPNEIMDEIVLSSSKTWHYSEYVYRCVFAGEDVDPGMKRYLLQEIARDIRAVGWEAWKKGYEEGYNKWVHGSMEAVEMLMGAVAGDGVHFEVKRTLDVDASATRMEGSRALISEDKLCKWHVHVATAKCGTPLAMVDVGRGSGDLKRKASFAFDGPETDFGPRDRPSQRGFGIHATSLLPSSRLQGQDVTRDSSFSLPAVTRPLSVVPPTNEMFAKEDGGAETDGSSDDTTEDEDCEDV
jgi:hypothetical protein